MDKDQFVAEVRSRGPQENVSTFAFTAATPEDDPTYERDKAHRLLKAFVELHDHAIHEKVRVMVEHFHQSAAHRINGRAKAMIVTQSRLHCVRYHRALGRFRGWGTSRRADASRWRR